MANGKWMLGLRWVILLASLLLFACKPGGETSELPSGRGAVIRLADADARGLDPQVVSDLASIRIAADQFEGLMRFNRKGEAEAGLAEAWQVSSDGRRWTFQLRGGLAFSDGEPITAAIFAKALARIRDAKTASPHAALFAIIEKIETPGARTVILHLTQPFPQLPALLAHPAMAALPFHRIEATGDGWTAERPLVTSGPYRLTGWKLAQAITLEANPRWHGGKPATAKIIWRAMENPQSAMRLMLARGADVSSNFPASRLGWLRENHAKLLHVHDYLGSYYFAFNTRRAPFDNRNVRLALAMAVDREWIAKDMIAAGNEPAWGLLPPGLSGGDSAKPEWADWARERRLAAARRLLAKAGYGKKKPLTFDVRFNSSSEHRRAAVAMATMWRDIGVDAKLLNSEASLHFDALRRGDFDLARSGWIADLPAPENFLGVHRSDAGPQNYSGYANPAYDAALDNALSEPDPAKRRMKIRAAEMMLIADMPILPLYFYVSRSLVQPDIRGWSDNISNVHPSRFLHKVAK
ncbi:MAG: peptide ABC transporter substrate-binding protein [Sphingorhabdus sp.]